MNILQSIFIPSVSLLNQKKQEAILIGEKGIDIGIKIRPDKTCLCFIKESPENIGASVTNSAEHIILFIYNNYLRSQEIELSKTAFIEIDSDGKFDFLSTESYEGTLKPVWSPVKILDHVRNRDAVEILFGKDATDLLHDMNVSRARPNRP